MCRGRVGEYTYAAPSCKKLKSLTGMSSMPREEPSGGESARDGARAGERTRVGSVDGERLACVSDDADRGLHAGVSAVFSARPGATMHRHRQTYSSTSASRGPRVNCLVRGATFLI